MKLKCKAHGRRVHVFAGQENKPTTVHRQDGSKCVDLLVMGLRTATPADVLLAMQDRKHFFDGLSSVLTRQAAVGGRRG